MAVTLYLMRHGEVHNPTKVLYGRLPDFHLSETGKQQAHSAGKWLQDKPISAIYCSPMERAQETAGIVASYHPELQLKIEERITEVHTPHDGKAISDLEAMGWDLYTGNEPPYEVPTSILERVHDFFEYLLDKHNNEQVIAVGHGDILVFPWLHAQGHIPAVHMKETLMDYNLPEAYPATASIMQYTYSDSPRTMKPTVAYIRPY